MILFKQKKERKKRKLVESKVDAISSEMGLANGTGMKTNEHWPKHLFKNSRHVK